MPEGVLAMAGRRDGVARRDLAKLALLDLALLVGPDEAMHGAVVGDAALVVVLAIAVRLGPAEAVQLAVALAARARGAREVGIVLHEEHLAHGARHKGRVRLRKQRAVSDVVPGHAHRDGRCRRQRGFGVGLRRRREAAFGTSTASFGHGPGFLLVDDDHLVQLG